MSYAVGDKSAGFRKISNTCVASNPKSPFFGYRYIGISWFRRKLSVEMSSYRAGLVPIKTQCQKHAQYEMKNCHMHLKRQSLFTRLISVIMLKIVPLKAIYFLSLRYAWQMLYTWIHCFRPINVIAIRLISRYLQWHLLLAHKWLLYLALLGRHANVLLYGNSQEIITRSTDNERSGGEWNISCQTFTWWICTFWK